MSKEVKVTDAKWTIDMENGWINLVLDTSSPSMPDSDKLMISTDNLDDVLNFIKKWHEPVSIDLGD